MFSSTIRRKFGITGIGLAAVLAFLVSAGVWAAPPAGTVIGNQASATYTDASGTTRTVTSNTVNTVVQQVASLTIASNGSRTVTPGGTVTFPHTITNTGNGSDSFNLVTANLGGDNFDFAGFSIYADSNGDGIPDNTTVIAATPSIPAGSAYGIVIAATLPGGVVATDVGQFTITATSAFDAGQSAANTDTATVTGNAVISMTKSIDVSSGAAGSTGYTYTFTYTNTGNSTATNVTLSDTIPAGMTYVANSGRWSLTGATVLTDANNADLQGTAPDQVIYDYNVTTATAVTVVLSRVLPGQSGSFSFQVDINAGVAPSIINNTGVLNYNDGAAAVGPFNTNTVAFTVTQSAAVTVGNDTIASANQGATISFTNLVTNNGNGTDSFDMTLSGSTFPAGTSFQFYQADGVTPLLDTNGNGTPDTGNIAAAGTYNVITQVTLPPAATGGPYTVNVDAASFFNSATTATGTATLTTITSSTVDFDDDTPAPVNTGVGNTAGAWNINTDPGTVATYTMYVYNTSGIGDTYDLSVTGLPAGWSAVFKDAGNSVISNTGLIAAAGNATITVEVTVPAGAAAGASAFNFVATSPSTAATDSFPAQVTVNTVYNVINSPNNTGQVFSGSAVTYSHTITNGSNVTETAIALAVVNDQPGWSAAIYLDDGTTPGVLDAGDSSYAAPLNLAVGASQVILVKVFAPAGVTAGVINTTTLSATGLSATAVNATDATTVISGNVQLLKEHALDAACDGTADTAYGIGDVNANPGECIMYQITATNVGAADATGIVVNDSTPAFTTYNTTGGAAATTVGVIGSAPANGSAGLISANVGTLTSGQNAVITFKVRIDP